MDQQGEHVQDFLAQRRLALVGLSRDPADFSRVVWKELQSRGYALQAVNPAGGEIDGQPVFPDLASLPEPVDGALVMTPPAASAAVVRAAAAAGIRRVWLHRGAGQGAVSEDAVAEGRAAGLSLVVGECPMMFLQNTAWFHRAHGGLRRAAGTWPLEPAPRARAVGLAAVQIFVGLGALGGGATLVADPTGAAIGLPLSLLAGTPFSDFWVPGLVLLGVNGLGQLGAAAVTLARGRRAGALGVALGALLLGWISLQVLWVGFISWMQPMILACALLELGLGWRHLRRGRRGG